MDTKAMRYNSARTVTKIPLNFSPLLRLTVAIHVFKRQPRQNLIAFKKQTRTKTNATPCNFRQRHCGIRRSGCTILSTRITREHHRFTASSLNSHERFAVSCEQKLGIDSVWYGGWSVHCGKNCCVKFQIGWLLWRLKLEEFDEELCYKLIATKFA